MLATALASGGCMRIQASDFTTDVCPTGEREPFAAVTPAVTVDSLELREVAPGNPSAAPTVVATRGTPCATATNAAGCMAALAATLPQVGWPQAAGDRERTVRYLVFTRGNDVGTITSLDALGAFLAPIDTGAEAAFLVTQANFNLQCGSTNLRTAGTGFELLANTGFACGEGTHLDANVVAVSREGVLRVLDTEVIERGSSNCAVGRRPEGFSLGDDAAPRASFGAWLAEMAALEAASVTAFRRLVRELRAHGAPASLVARAEGAMRDEVRHARVTRSLAARFGANVARVSAGPMRVRSRLDVARENAAEGCVRETFGALVATLQASRARDPEIARAMRQIARDETRHAALAWAVAAWIEPTLTAQERASVEHARQESVAQLARDLRRDPPREAMTLAGAPSAAESRALLDGLSTQASLAA